MPKRMCLVVSSKSVRRQPEKLGPRWWKVWNKVLPGDRCWQSGVLVDQVCQRHEWVVPGIAARYREWLCIAQYCNLILYALRDPQPVKADECICDVVGAFQIEDQPCRCIQNRLESVLIVWISVPRQRKKVFLKYLRFNMRQNATLAFAS